MATLTDVRNPAVPNLPFAPRAYDPRYNEQLNNVLRLYFNQITTAISVQSDNADTLQTEIDAIGADVIVVTAATQRNQTLLWLSM